jgi:hypothetical protein
MDTKTVSVKDSHVYIGWLYCLHFGVIISVNPQLISEIVDFLDFQGGNLSLATKR